MTSAQVVETSVTVTDNSPFQDYPHPDDHTTRSTVTPGFKPFTVKRETIDKAVGVLAAKLSSQHDVISRQHADLT